MSHGPEYKVKEACKKVLKSMGAYWHMPVQTGLGAPSLDIIACYQGRYVAIECKAEGKRPTPRQEHTMSQINAAGGTTLVIDSVELAKQLPALLTLP